MFYVGQKVACVDADAVEGDGRVRLREGRIYTVRKIATHSVRWFRLPKFKDEHRVVWLEEITDRPGDDTPYCVLRFRPVVERKTDISIFTAMLNPSKVEEPA